MTVSGFRACAVSISHRLHDPGKASKPLALGRARKIAGRSDREASRDRRDTEAAGAIALFCEQYRHDALANVPPAPPRRQMGQLMERLVRAGRPPPLTAHAGETKDVRHAHLAPIDRCVNHQVDETEPPQFWFDHKRQPERQRRVASRMGHERTEPPPRPLLSATHFIALQYE